MLARWILTVGSAMPRPRNESAATSNTAVAIAEPSGAVRFLEFSLLGAPTQSFRSLLFFDPEEQEAVDRRDADELANILHDTRI